MLTIRTGKPADAGVNDTGSSGDRATVAVIIPTFNHARFLADAIMSVLAQTRQADEIIVVDDGSTDDPATVVAQFQKVRLIRQDNRGLSAARNTGLRNCTTSHVVFLDADDRLLPAALEAGFNCIAGHPDCAFVYGGYRLMSEDGHPLSSDIVMPIAGDAYLALLRRYLVGAIMAVLYRRDCLMAMNGSNEAFRCSVEDYELNLRIVKRYPIASHSAVVAEYRKHDQAMSNDSAKMLKTVLQVLDFHEAHIATDPVGRAALQEGRAHYRSFYVSRMINAAAGRWRARHRLTILVGDLVEAARSSPNVTMSLLLGALARRVSKVLPRPLVEWIQRIRGRPYRIPFGSVRFGDLKRSSPIGHEFGLDRGTPVDRYYIENFLGENAHDICGRVLEIGDNSYTLRFGGARVNQSDILHVNATNPRATIIGDITQPEVLPEGAFDCIVLTQTLHLVYDMRAAVGTLHRALKPGGVLLLTVPGITQIDRSEWRSTWYWSLTGPAARRLLEDHFGHNAVTVKTHGNVFAATAFLYALATEELNVSDLDVDDESYPVIVAARAVKRKDA